MLKMSIDDFYKLCNESFTEKEKQYINEMQNILKNEMQDILKEDAMLNALIRDKH